MDINQSPDLNLHLINSMIWNFITNKFVFKPFNKNNYIDNDNNNIQPRTTDNIVYVSSQLNISIH